MVAEPVERVAADVGGERGHAASGLRLLELCQRVRGTPAAELDVRQLGERVGISRLLREQRLQRDDRLVQTARPLQLEGALQFSSLHAPVSLAKGRTPFRPVKIDRPW